MNVSGTESVSNGSIKAQDGVLDKPEDAGKGKEGVVNRWMLEIALADKLEKDWRHDGARVLEIYRGKKKKQNSFNIVWANSEVILPNLYNSTPKPDCRRRYRDDDVIGRQCSVLIERALNFEADCCDIDGLLKSAVFDSVLPGRGTGRVMFAPTFEEEKDENGVVVGKKLTSVKLELEPVEWDNLRRGPASRWKRVPWLAYKHLLTKSEIEDKFPDFKGEVTYDAVLKGASDEEAEKEPSVYKRVVVWEIWDKEERNVLWIAPSYDEAPLAEEGDKLGLKDFFDTPEPIYSLEDTTTLEPVCEYTLYEDQAEELNTITQRITKLTRALKVRGIYDATLNELANLMNEEDNAMLPTRDSTAILQAGGFDKAIWMLPLNEVAVVLKQLYVQREQIKMTIYEVTGISDILRGQSDPNETLGAQELKVQSGSVRIKRRQRDVQRFARDLFRIMAEIISEHYTPEMLQLMTGIPVTEEMIAVLRRDLLRGIKIDIETDSTIAADEAAMRRDATELLEGIGGFAQAFGPAIQSGVISEEVAKKIFQSIVRKARMGREIEEAIEEDAAQPQQPKPDPEMMKLQAEQQNEQAKMQMQQQSTQAELHIKAQASQADAAMKAQQAQSDASLAQQRLQAEFVLKQQESAALIQLKREESAALIALKREEMQANLQLKREHCQADHELKSQQA